ncbi:glycosyltransferase family 22 protein [Serpula lacrymans var. lacrymans S7.3]|uniref:Mannosyltransferase n=2 Tax=Serpula lacrymans var. lacrymans TaxID=341189 RepID=F8PXX0_SERL3|nr:glycosyltransferase family 22 protein [Serpula lacrymans var. lacrymans S7.9]EGN98733.1 glycosyltransferase family 22 protein [Serpula lacrymans var. lacrymans S7.3]EGO24330.1 glycosyltransferase family 22 protein [Serpula lacrymans var. lacrymans S7.9]
MSFALDLLLLATGWTHVWLAPYTKVEESFNLHATHDVLSYGVAPDALHNYDHFVFSGVVPRTFIGSLILAWLSTPILHIASAFGFITSKLDIQIAVRLVLSSLNAFGLILLRRAVFKRFGRPTGLLFVLLTCSQSHVPFWMGRTLPNMFALFPVNLAFFLLNNRASNSLKPSTLSVHAAFSILTFTAVVFRSEVAILLAPLALQSLFLQHTRFLSLIKVGIISAIASIGTSMEPDYIFRSILNILLFVALTVLVDSYFWDQWPLWPEFNGLYFNVFQGKSAEWGVSPAHAYFSSHLPKLLLGSLPLSALGALLDARIRSLLIPCLAFIALISALGHKEWRFIVYAVPVFNIAAARGARWMVSRRKGRFFGRLLFLGATGIIAANLLVTVMYTRVSAANYPGGSALAVFNKRYADWEHVHVHISNLAAQTGASLFLQDHSPPHIALAHSASAPHHWVYNKTESLSPKAITASSQITHVIAEAGPESQKGYLKTGKWDIAFSIEGFSGWRFNLPWRGWRVNNKAKIYEWVSQGLGSVMEMDTREELWVLERT